MSGSFSNHGQLGRCTELKNWDSVRIGDYTLGTRGNRWALNSMLRMDANLSQTLDSRIRASEHG